MSHQRRSDQEWLAIFNRYEKSSLTQKDFCQKNKISTSTFFAKRRLLKASGDSSPSGFVRAEIVEQTTRYQIEQPAAASMTLSLYEVELSIPANTSDRYVAELISALSS